MNNEHNINKFIPQNAIKKYQFFGINYMNWVEAIAIPYLVGKGIWATTLVLKIKIICIIVICISLFILFLKGIKNRSVLTFIFDLMKDTGNHNKYKLGSVNDERRIKNTSIENQFGGMSLYERLLFNIKSKFKRFDDKYGKIDEDN